MSAAEPRTIWREGYDAGLRNGVGRYLNLPFMEDLALELAVLRAAYPVVCEALTAAEHQIEVLEAELDYRAPGWHA